jgi:hypothetical protein
MMALTTYRQSLAYKDVQMDTGDLDELETLEDRVGKERAKQKERAEARRKRQHAAKKLKTQGAEAGEDISGLHLALLMQLKNRRQSFRRKRVKKKSALEVAQCTIQFGNAAEKEMGTQLLSQKLGLLKQMLDDEQMKHDLASLGIREDVNVTTMEQV